MIDQATAQRIKDAADIVEVVSDYVHLVRRGQNYMGLCPFHNERTPSFSVNRKRNFCFCFSCKKGGSPVNFIMEKEGLSYKEALLHLAKKYGIEVQERELSDEERQRQSEREGMLVANEWAMKLMEHDMMSTADGRDIGLQYLMQRGVTEAAMKAFHLGYALDSGHHLADEARKAGYDLEVLKKTGLIGTSQQGHDYDRFRGRVIFPILNNSGKVIAFGGRDIKGGLAKYINSPESAVYKKSNELYGIFQARAAIVKENKCFLVEGYMDVIGMWQSGMKNVVASSGTALTDGQIALIHRLTDNITLIYDGDAAGIKASLRGIDMLLNHKLNVKVLLLPDGEDPDSFARKHTPEEFREYVDKHETDIIRFKIDVLLDEQTARDPQKRIEAVNSVVQSIAHIPDPVARDVYVQECARLLGVTEESIIQSVGRARAMLIQKWKKEREWNATRESAAVIQQPADTVGTSSDQAQPDANTDFSQQPSRKTDIPFRPLETPLIKLCVRYGYKGVFQPMDEDDDTLIDVLDYVQEELESDGMRFSVEEYSLIFQELQRVKPMFYEALQRRKMEIEEDVARKRREGIEEIGSGSYSIDELKIKESKLEESLREYATSEVNEYVKDWPARFLSSHENDIIRSTSFDLLREKHHLSNIYANAPGNEKEEDRLEMLVPRTILEWKSEILNQRLRELLRKFQDMASNMNIEEEHSLQAKLNSLMKLRRKIAKELGERILLPKSQNSNK